MNCFKCRKELELSANSDIPRGEQCPDCFADLRSCKMCMFHDSMSYNECREPSADRVVDKEKANFCDYYKIGEIKNLNDSSSNAASIAESLFKK
jgi:hypothetical protein